MTYRVFATVAMITIATLLADCGGSQPPTGGPGATVQTLHHDTSSDGDLLYATNSGVTWVYTLPQDKLVESFDVPGVLGMCSDRSGNVFMLGAYDRIYEYHHGAATPFTTLYDDYGAPRWCSVDPVSGNLAVMNEGNEIGIWTGAQGSPTFYTIGALADNASCAYDDSGDLFIVGLAQKTNATTLVEMPDGSNSFTTITLNHTPKGLPLGLQWSGSSLAMGFFRERTLYLIDVSGSLGTIMKKVHVNGLYKSQFQGWIISGSTLISATRPRSEDISEYRWPKGGKALEQFHVPTRDYLTALAVSSGASVP